MASWMVHLRVADKLLDTIGGLSAREFIMGNIAPDSGVPNEDWSSFSPSTKVSHFRKDSCKKVGKVIDISAFIQKYFTPELQIGYSPEQEAFFLGYLVHLLTDILWSDKIAVPCTQKFSAEYEADFKSFVQKMKDDWYDLDFLYLKKHPDFRAFRIYRDSEGFTNTYMDIFSPDAFDNRREYITGFYEMENDHLNRVYPYLTEAEADEFVNLAAAQILKDLPKFCVESAAAGL